MGQYDLFFVFVFFGWHAAAKQQKQCGIICMLMHMCWEYSIRGSTSPTQPGKRQCQRCPLAPLRLINLAFPHSLLIKSNYLYSRGLAPLSFFFFFKRDLLSGTQDLCHLSASQYGFYLYRRSFILPWSQDALNGHSKRIVGVMASKGQRV